MDKCGLLLPPSAPVPNAEVMFPLMFDVGLMVFVLQEVRLEQRNSFLNLSNPSFLSVLESLKQLSKLVTGLPELHTD